jgi:predicted Zn-dependent protease
VTQGAQAYTYYVSDLNGVPVRWFKSPVEVKISTVEPSEVSWEMLDDALRKAIATWNAVDGCTLPLIVHAGTTEIIVAEAPEDIDAFTENTVIPIHSPEVWSSKGYSSSLLAITSLTYDRESGVMVDADIEINDWNHVFSSGLTPIEGANDLENTLTHEFGHFLGMDHSDEPGATMYGQAPAGEEKKRSLEQDDTDGLCDLYQEFTLPDLRSSPDGAHAEAPDDTGSCCQTYRTPNGNVWVYSFVLLMLVAFRASRRSQESS